jgi:hypothetical protein
MVADRSVSAHSVGQAAMRVQGLEKILMVRLEIRRTVSHDWVWV